MKKVILSISFLFFFRVYVWAQIPQPEVGQLDISVPIANTRLGDRAGFFLNTGYLNSFFGYFAGYQNTIGTGNSFFGAQSGYINIDGNYNSFFGTAAGYSNNHGGYNSFFGYYTGNNNINGQYNAFFGSQSGYFNTYGNNNAFFGSQSGYSNTTGGSNAFFGNQSGYSNTTGVYNAFFGSSAGYNNTTGTYNAFFGSDAGFSNTTGYSNAFFGRFAGYFNTTGYNNSFFGNTAGGSNTMGGDNSFFGQGARYGNTTGNENAFFGSSAGYNNTSGAFNTFFGSYAGLRNTLGAYNAFFGQAAGFDNTTGYENSFFGPGAGFNNSTGHGNVFLGYNSGFQETGSNKLYIANDSTSKPLIYGEFDNKIVNVNGSLGIGIQKPERPIHLRAHNAIFRIDRDQDDPGFAVVRYSSNFGAVWKSFYFYTHATGVNTGQFVVADWGTNVSGPSTPRLVIDNTGNVGIGTTTPSQKLTVSGNVLATGSFITSDKRFKKDIQTIPQAMDRLNKLKGVSYSFETQKFADKGLPEGKTLGLIAQEVEKVFPELVSTDSEGYKAVNYDGLIPVLIEALKSQDARIQELEAKLANKNQGNTKIEDLKKAQLFQNQPNPFDRSTMIRFHLPETLQSATLFIYDMQGTQLMKNEIRQRGDAQITLEAQALSAGMYLYTLIADGQEVDTKRMIITR